MGFCGVLEGVEPSRRARERVGAFDDRMVLGGGDDRSGVLEGIALAEAVEKSIDLEPYLHGRVFAEIRSDPAVFASVKVDAEAGTITWPNGADLAPDVLYEGRRSARMESEARAS